MRSRTNLGKLKHGFLDFDMNDKMVSFCPIIFLFTVFFSVKYDVNFELIKQRHLLMRSKTNLGKAKHGFLDCDTKDKRVSF